MNIVQSPSPNHGARPIGTRISLVVMHGTVGTDAGDLSWLRNPTAGVSYHFLVLRDGAVHQLVHDERRAWHAGRSEWNGAPDVNDFSIGVGLSNLGPREGNPEPFTAAQYRAAGDLVYELTDKYTLPLSAVLGHYHVSPGRKTDPWEHFEWGRLFDRVLYNFSQSLRPDAA